MAEESKSWFPNIGLLSESSLQGMDPALQDQLQRESVKRFVFGGLLSGRPDVAFQSAIGVPTDYMTRQNQITAMQQQAERDRAVQSAYQPAVAPLIPGSQQVNALAEQLKGLSPEDVAYETKRIVQTAEGVTPKVFNPAIYMQNALPVIGRTDPTKMAEALKSMRPYSVESGSQLRDPFTNKVMGYAPGGVEKGQTIQINPITGKEEVVDLPGAIASIANRTEAEKAAAAKFDFEPVVVNGQTIYKSKYELSGAGAQDAIRRAEGDVAGLKREIAATKPTETGRLAILNQELEKANTNLKNLTSGQPANVKAMSAPEEAWYQTWKKSEGDAYDSWKQTQKHSSALQSLQNIMNRPDFDTNAFSGYKGQIAAILNASHIATEKQKSFLNSQTSFRQAVNDFAVNAVSELSGATSDRDIQFGKERFVTLTDPKQANQYAIDLMAASDKRKEDYYNFIHNNRDPDAIQKWQQSDQGKASIFESPSMRKYLPQSTVQDGPYKGQTAYQLPNGKVKVF